MQRFIDKFPETSGNVINGLGEASERRASPFFWHPPDRQTHGALQKEVTDYHRQSAEVRKWFSPNPPDGRGPETISQNDEKVTKSPAEWSDLVKQHALANEGDLVGIAEIDPAWIYAGYEIAEPRVIVVGVSMDYTELAQAPSSFENTRAAVVVAREYNRAARACRELRNFILRQGYFARAYQGPYATALNFLPAAIAAGFGELGKHGSLINREYGSSLRLSAVTTDMPLVPDAPDVFGADEFCMRCQACTNACPPDAISNNKQLVRGVEKWYVNFDKCIPYFGETLGCALCLAQCPWSRPGNSINLIDKLRKRATKKAAGD
jgi:Pyruvate/2-oxoacid:ferredoxin oxidoreductase delta subunit